MLYEFKNERIKKEENDERNCPVQPGLTTVQLV
jgi:hypothetical protein